MKKLLLASTLLASLPIANAQASGLFGPTVNIQVTNSPGTDGATVAIGGGATAIGAAGVTLNITQVAAGGGKEWLVFQYQSTDATLSQPGQSWTVDQYITAAVDVNLIGDFTQFTDFSGVPFDQTVSIFGQGLLSNPVPGGSGNGEGTLGYTAPFPAGALPDLGAFSHPFSIVTNGLGTTQVYGFTQALEFEAQNPVVGAPEASTWAMGVIGFGFMAGLGLLRTRRPPISIADAV